MLISVKELDKYWKIHPKGVLHVGAHLAEESSDYEAFRWGDVVWVEAQSNLANTLRKSLDSTRNSVYEAVIWETDNEIKRFGVASNSQSSSLLQFSTHSESYPDIKMVEYYEVKTRRLDTLLAKAKIGNFLNLDIQGVELNAIKSLGSRLSEIDFIYTEVNRKEVYENCTKVTELDAFLNMSGFKRKATRWYRREGWGDALYVRNEILLKRSLVDLIRIQFKNFAFYFIQFLRNILRNN